MASAIERRLAELGIVLPAAPRSVAAYEPWRIVGDLVFVSGQLPIVDGKLQYGGRVGSDLDEAAAAEAARICAINVLAQLRAACDGDLSRVTGLARVGVFVSSSPDFTAHPQVANAASSLFIQVLGDAGRHARCAVGCAALPLGASVEVEAVAQVELRRS